MVFENTQIKSATDNIGTFDGGNPDIRYSIDELDEEEYARQQARDDQGGSFHRDRLSISKTPRQGMKTAILRRCTILLRRLDSISLTVVMGMDTTGSVSMVKQ